MNTQHVVRVCLRTTFSTVKLLHIYLKDLCLSSLSESYYSIQCTFTLSEVHPYQLDTKHTHTHTLQQELEPSWQQTDRSWSIRCRCESPDQGQYYPQTLTKAIKQDPKLPNIQRACQIKFVWIHILYSNNIIRKFLAHCYDLIARSLNLSRRECERLNRWIPTFQNCLPVYA